MGKRKRYTDQFRTDAVLMLEAAGYPDKDGALMEVSRHLDVPHSTLSRWFRKIQNPPPSDLVRDTKRTLIEEIEELLRLHITTAMDIVGDSEDIRAVDTGIGILVDKLRLLSGEPTETQEQRIKVERHGISTIPEHLARESGAHSNGAPKIQRGSVRA